ncbi:hypothetical protein JTE90_009018 [Oedothorax gibbosus]|uniref:HEAT repeat-containing protein 2 n=1 Tax=Oedothorax gibbosus TaxID=931172 RepID=A0AAV6VM02_9ARAC|nr:hypothetical protein JTE90_009018 [Oedothorax gibbosus]
MESDCKENRKISLEETKNLKVACEKISLKGTDIISRRNYLKEIQNFISSLTGVSFEEEQNDDIKDTIFKSLILALSDDSEKCREIAATTLKHACFHFPITEASLTSLLSTLALRLNRTDEQEKSEEVRLLEMDVLFQVIDTYPGDLMPFLSDMSSIISSCIVDECPEVKRKSCQCLTLLATKTPHFHMVGGNFLKPLLSTLAHQHLKTRALCIRALGCIADHINSDEFKETASHLAQRLFDRSPVVRTAVTEVVGEMLLSLKDRYSYFHRLIPLLLSALYDDVEEIRSKALDLWIKAGNQYLSENEKDFKDLIDYPRPDPVDYPESASRPTLGCRTLVQRHLYNILQPLLNDIGDWVVETRVKTSQVLYSLVLHAEDKITIKLPSVLEGILLGAVDDNKEVVEYSLKASELLGYFVSPPLLCDSILSMAHPNPTWVHLSVLAAILRGHSGPLPRECFSAICKFLADPSVARFREPKEQANLLLCVEGLISNGNAIDSSISYELFTILVSISGLTTNEQITSKSQELLKELENVQSCSEVPLLQQHNFEFVKSLIENNELWTCHSPEMPIFKFVVEQGCFDTDMAGLIFPVFINNLFPAKEAKLRSQMLSLLIPVFKKLSPFHFEAMSEKILDLIKSGIFPNLTWSAGKTACSLRTLATASLYEILNQSDVRKEMFKSLGADLLPTLSTLLEDDAATTRLLSCKIMERALPDLVGSVDDLKIHRTCYELLGCMDDQSDEVRLMATKVLKAYVKSFPSDYDWKLYRSYMKHMFETVLVHLDDGNGKIQQGVLELLKDVAFAAPDVLLEEIEAKKYMMAAGDICDDLVEHVKQIKI